METRKHRFGPRRLMLLAGILAALLAVLPAAGGAAPDPGTEYPAESCLDPNIDCGTGESDTGVLTESWDEYDYAPGICRTRWARATRRNLAHLVVYRYNEQVRWCYRNNVITYFWRDRWPSATSFGWSFDGHIGTNCAYEHCPNRGVGTYSTDAWTQGHFHVCVTWYCTHKYPIVDIWVHGDGGSGASASGA